MQALVSTQPTRSLTFCCDSAKLGVSANASPYFQLRYAGRSTSTPTAIPTTSPCSCPLNPDGCLQASQREVPRVTISSECQPRTRWAERCMEAVLTHMTKIDFLLPSTVRSLRVFMVSRYSDAYGNSHSLDPQ